jgi:hypothetical protein
MIIPPVAHLTVLRTILFSLLATTGCAAKAPTQYTITTIDMPFADVQYTAILGMNNHGIRVGEYQDSRSELLGFRGTKGRYTMEPLMVPQAINTARVTAGWYRSYQPDGMRMVGFINTGTSMIPIRLRDMADCKVMGINDANEVVGDCTDASGYFHAFFRDANGHDRRIGPPFESASGYVATGINNARQVVGGYGESGWFWTGQTYVRVNVPGTDFTLPHSINAKGQIAGVACTGASCAGFTLKHGAYQTIMVPGSSFTAIFEIIDNGTLAGTWYGPDGRQHGFVATPK